MDAANAPVGLGYVATTSDAKILQLFNNPPIVRVVY